jgi:hypothetical protein
MFSSCSNVKITTLLLAFLFIFRQHCVWHTDSCGAKQQVLGLEICSKSFGTG